MQAQQARAQLPWEPDCLIPAQWFARRRAELSPHKRLVLAVLEDAVATLDHARSSNPKAVAAVAEVRRWVASDREDGPFTFLSVCEALGLDPEWLRAGLQRYPPRRAAQRA